MSVAGGGTKVSASVQHASSGECSQHLLRGRVNKGREGENTPCCGRVRRSLF